MRQTLTALLLAALVAPSAHSQVRPSAAPAVGGLSRPPVGAMTSRVPGAIAAGSLPVVGGRLPAAGARVATSASARLGAGVAVTDAMLARAAPTELRQLQVRRLLQRHPGQVDLDPRGEPVLQREFLVLGPDAAMLDAVGRAGFTVREAGDGAEGLGLRIVVLEDTRTRSAAQAMDALRRAAPGVEFHYQHVYLPSGSATDAPLAGAAPGAGTLRVGLVDGGVDAAHPALAGMRVRHHGCGGRPVAQVHGTTVAVRLAGGARGDLYAADLWCGDGPGRATLGLVEALAWMSREQVPVVNISLVGPANAVLARAVDAMQARGHLIVAAVGNDGPAAPPLYPAAYPGVVGVAAVDERLRLLPESGSGAHVDFVAPGVVAGGRKPLRGTSYAAPVVSRSLARLLHRPIPEDASRALGIVSAKARDLGRPGLDPRYGRGLVAPQP